MSLKFKLKAYFKTRDTSETAVEFMRMFILPFLKAWNPEASLDSAIDAFFGTLDRKFYRGTAKRDFKMPGLWFKIADRAIPRAPEGTRNVVKGQAMLLVVDRRTGITKIDITKDNKDFSFKLSRAELEFIKDYVDVKEA